MIITLGKREFIKCLDMAGSFAGKSKTLPILDCVKMKIAKDHITLVSCDTESAISKRMIADNPQVEGEEEYCVDFKDLYQYVKLSSGDEVSMNFGNETVTVSQAKGEMTLPLFKASQFPKMKSGESDTTVELPSALVNNWIVEGMKFISTEELRPIMTQIYFYCEDGEFGACASDGHVLYWNKDSLECPNFSFTIGKNASRAVCSMAKECDTMTVRIGENNVLFLASNGSSVITRPVVGRFPNFRSVFPKNNPISIKVDKNELMEALDRCKLGANQASLLAKLELDGMNLRISAQDLDFSKKAKENLLVESNGAITIGFKASLLVMLLSNVDSDSAILELSDPSRPCLVKEDKEDSNKVMLLMPMMLID